MAESIGAPIAAQRPARVRSFAIPEPLVSATVGAVAFGVALRALCGAGLPLWLDETFTGAMAAQATFRSVIQQSLLEANGPLYSIFMHLWSQQFGLSNSALRAPAFLFGVAAPLVALIPAKGISKEVRLLWCALAALWIPAIWYSQEARCYSLLFCLTMGCTVAYARLLANPNIRQAAIWTCLSSIAILTHYHALLLVALQGIAYLAVHRAQAMRTWPAALAFLPALAWICLQLPRIGQFADPDATWFGLLTFADALSVLNFILGNVGLIPALALIVAIPAIVRRRDAGPNTVGADADMRSYLWVVVATAAFSAATVIIIGMARPSFTVRYLMPFMPGILLGFAWTIAQLGKRWALAPVAVLLVVAGGALGSFFGHAQQAIKYYNFEAASHSLMASGAKRLVFLWDNPVTRVYDPSQLEAAGAFFFRREDKGVTVEPIYLKPDDDPNARLLSAAVEPGSAILWIYDLNIRATAARSHPPRIEQIDPAWRCEDFGRGPFGIIACYRGAAPLS